MEHPCAESRLLAYSASK